MKKKKNKNKGSKKGRVVADENVLVAPVVARATDGEQQDQVRDDVVDEYLQASVPQKDKDTEEKKSTHKHEHKHVHSHCQSPILRKKVKNLTSALIFFTGISAGLLFVDVAQFFTERGLSAKALGETSIVHYDGATWVKYDEPKVQARVFLSRENSEETKEDVDELLSALGFFMPTLEVFLVDVDTPAGREQALEQGIGYAPAVHFDRQLAQNAYYKNTTDLFLPREDGSYILRMGNVDIVPDHVFIAPDDTLGMVIGSPQADHSVVVYENALCDDCLDLHKRLTQVQKDFPEQLKVVYKSIPESDNEASRAAAYAGHCAYEQGHYDRFMQILLTNSAWKVVKPDDRENLFGQYAGYIFGLDGGEFASCYSSRKFDDQLVSDIAEADLVGVGSVPAVFVDGVYTPHADLDYLVESVTAEVTAQ